MRVKFKISDNAEIALKLGISCSVFYFVVYTARNLLGVLSPSMIKTSAYSIEYIGTISTLYMFTYALGQMINGIIGDKIIARYMVSVGLILSGLCNLFFPIFQNRIVIAVVYGVSGFFLSMIYAPMTKVITENTLPKFAVRCVLCLTLVSFLGSPAAGLFAILFDWKSAFVICGLFSVFMGVAAFFLFVRFEKSGAVKYNQFKNPKKEKGNLTSGIKLLVDNGIIKYTIVSMITGIVRTSVIFWTPTYLSEYLSFNNEISVTVYSVITVVLSVMPFVTIFIYERVFRQNMNANLLFAFALGTVSFFMMFAVKEPVLNGVFLSLALFANGAATTILWSIYCPALRDTGMVSTATGYLDFISYIAAALANILFSRAVPSIGWKNLLLVWVAIMAVGIIVSLPFNRKSKN